VIKTTDDDPKGENKPLGTIKNVVELVFKVISK
jgi:hypothetical protein